jgi:hypothetical protein
MILPPFCLIAFNISMHAYLSHRDIIVRRESTLRYQELIHVNWVVESTGSLNVRHRFVHESRSGLEPLGFLEFSFMGDMTGVTASIDRMGVSLVIPLHQGLEYHRPSHIIVIKSQH